MKPAYSATDPSPMPGWRLVLEGPFGSGKTTALKPILDAHTAWGFAEPMKLNVLSLDPNTWPVLGGTAARISQIKTVASRAGLRDMFTKAQSLDNKALQESEFRKRGDNLLLSLIDRLEHFVALDGKDYGDIGSWGTDTIFAIDGLSGLTDAIASGNLGPKPAWTQPDYQRVMNCISEFLKQLVQTCFCHVVLIAHVEYEEDDLGVRYIMPSTAGKKLAPKIGRGFTDVVFAERKDGKFTWSTVKRGADLTARHISMGEGLPASITSLFTYEGGPRAGEGPRGWFERGGIVSPVVPKVWTEPDYYKV